MKIRFLIITSLVLAAATWRMFPHQWNFAPVGALALFAGAYLSPRWAAFLVPFAAMALSDVVLYQTFHREHFALDMYLADRLVVYGCFAVWVSLGFWLRPRRTPLPIAGAACAGSAFFFLATNFAVWLMGWGLSYPRTWDGLLSCYIVAIPFHRNTAISDVLFTGVFFGGFALAEWCIPALRDPVIDPATDAVPRWSPAEQEECVPAAR